MIGLLPRRSAQAVAALVAVLVTLLVGTAIAPAAAAAPISVDRPKVTGPVTEGARLTASRGSWKGTGRVATAYRWYRCDTMGAGCRVLRGVTGRSHLLGANDVGHTLSVAVRATDSRGSSTAYASLVGPIGGGSQLVSTERPSISGAAVEASTLRVGTGHWSRSPNSFTYQWARCNDRGRACAPIGGATDDSYKVGSNDLGHALAAIVQARSGATTQAVFSIATAKAVPAKTGVGPSSSSSPLVAVVVQAGQRLTGVAGTWSGSGTIEYSFRWYRCDVSGAHCKTVRGATGATYMLGAKDVGQTLGFAVRATDAGGTTTAYATLVGPVAAAGAPLVSTGQPTIAGTAAPGQTLQVSNGSWSSAPTSFGYQWQRCNQDGRVCVPIPGATAAGYAVAAADSGHRLVAVVHATLGKVAQDALSGGTAVVTPPPGPTMTASPTVTGTIQNAQQLTGVSGTWSGAGTIGYAFQWYRCDAAGAHCKSVHGATSATYMLGAKDVGQTLGLAVIATDAGGTTTAHASLVGPVAAAGAPLVSTGQPTIAGTAAPGQTLSVSNGSWSSAPASFGYQWQRCNPNGRLCVPIAGATAASYAVGAADAGHALVVVIQASSSGGAQAVLSLAAVVH